MLGESFYGCFSGYRRPPGSSAPLPTASLTDDAAAAATTSASSAIVFKNFNSLFDHPISDSEALTGTVLSSPADAAYPSLHDLSAAIASRRLLPASPGRSNSIVDPAAVAVAVPTYSPHPYRDFRRSMEEMVKALGLDAGGSAARKRAYLDELLLCYLALNRKSSHECIISAFTDLLLALEPPGGGGGDRDPA